MDAAQGEVWPMSIKRILVVLPLYGGSLPIGEYCASALVKMGFSVRVFDAPELNPAFLGLKRLDISPGAQAGLENSFLRFVSQAVWTQAEEFKPQLVLALAQAPLDKNILRRMRQAGMRTVMWFVEDSNIFLYWRALAPFYDAFATIQKEPFLSQLEATGQKHAFYLPLAALPDFHKHLELGPEEKREYGSDIAFLGAGYPNRRKAFRRLIGRNFKIWGSDWEGAGALAPHVQRNGARISAEESVKIYNAAKINLNLHSSVQTDKLVSGGDFVNPRVFELAAMGAFQLVDRRGLMGELFRDNELATFTKLDELEALLDHFLEHPEERKAYAERARARVLADHTYEKRMRTLLEYMEEEFGPWPESDSEKLVDASPEWREKLVRLAERLGLSPDSSFEDLVARLRKTSGELGEEETAILFLDEWRKQYGR